MRNTNARTHSKTHIGAFRFAAACSPGARVYFPALRARRFARALRAPHQGFRSLARCACFNVGKHKENTRTQGNQRNARLEIASQNVVKCPRQGSERQRKTLPKYSPEASPNGGKNLPKSTKQTYPNDTKMLPGISKKVGGRT